MVHSIVGSAQNYISLNGYKRQTQLHDTQHNDIQHNDTQHKDIQLNNKENATLSIMTFSLKINKMPNSE